MTRLKSGGCLVFLYFFLFACASPRGEGDALSSDPDTSAPPGTSVSGGNVKADAYVITSDTPPIGGPLADGQKGDIYLRNDKIHLVIQRPGAKDAPFGGTSGGDLIDMDFIRPDGESGQDNLLDVFPMLNLEWTADCDTAEILEDDVDKYGFVRVRFTCGIAVQEYITPSLIETGLRNANYRGYYPDRFRNILDPLESDAAFSGLSPTVVTEYLLYRGAEHVKIKTTIRNDGDNDILFPVGDWISASGFMEMFMPMHNFANPFLEYQLSGNLPGNVYSAYDDGEGDETKVSYAYLYDPRPFKAVDRAAEEGTAIAIQGVAVSAPGQVIFKFSDKDAGLIPMCRDPNGNTLATCTDGKADSTVRAAVPPGEFSYSRYIGIGRGSVGEALGNAYSGLGVSAALVSGQVLDKNRHPVPFARVVFVDKTAKVASTVLLTDASGRFSGKVARGGDWVTEKLGSGEYKVEVYKEGYALEDGLAGSCNPGIIDIRGEDELSDITCRLGDSVAVHLGDIFDAESGDRIPATLVITGADPSPKQAKYGDIAGFYDVPHGLVGTLLYNPSGRYQGFNHRPLKGRTLMLEPGTYTFLYHRGTEYNVHAVKVTLEAGKPVVLSDVALKHVVPTPGYIAVDFHVHSRDSLDVPTPEDVKALSAAAAGMDLINAANHDVITSYAQAIAKSGMREWMAAWSGEEITPLLLGHFLGVGLDYDAADRVDGGAVDYTDDPRDPVGPGRDYNLPLADIFEKVREDSGESLILVAHILNHNLGYMYLNGFATSPLLDTEIFAVYGDPAKFRLGDTDAPAPHAALSTDNSALDFDGLELAVSTDPTSATEAPMIEAVMAGGLPTAFNLFNQGKLSVMTIDNDGHRPISEPLGNVRNYCRSSVDPADLAGGTYGQLETASVQDDVIRNIKAQHCFMTNGPYLQVKVQTSGKSASFGDVLALAGGGAAELVIQIDAPAWVGWDKVEVYINEVPEPDLGEDMTDEEFYTQDPIYTMTPAYTYSLGDRTLEAAVSGGKRSSLIRQSLSVAEDSWIVVVVRGTDGVSPSAFPVNPRGLDAGAKENSAEQLVDNVYRLFMKGENTLKGGIPFYAIGNPVYIDVDGDTNGDGHPFEAIYIRDDKRN